jgi:hypothetical protein
MQQQSGVPSVARREPEVSMAALTEGERKVLNNAFIGTAGSVILLLIGAVIVFSVPGDEPPAGIAMAGGLAFLGMVAFWISGMANVLRIVFRSRVGRQTDREVVSYIPGAVPLAHVLVGAIVGGG